jgi:hypothetical protein
VSLVVGQRMVRTDDGMRGVVELVAMPGFEQYSDLRITYLDRGEKRIAGKRETWTVEQAPPRKLLDAEVLAVASIADRLLRALEKNEPSKWWLWTLDAEQAPPHDPELVALIRGYLEQRG